MPAACAPLSPMPAACLPDRARARARAMGGPRDAPPPSPAAHPADGLLHLPRVLRHNAGHIASCRAPGEW